MGSFFSVLINTTILMFIALKQTPPSFVGKISAVLIRSSMGKLVIMQPLQLQRRGECISFSTMAVNWMESEAFLMEIL